MRAKQFPVTIGIIGGSGLYRMKDLVGVKEVAVRTPYGRPSGEFVIGSLDGRKVVFLARHGPGHSVLPSGINFRANIFGMKMLGVERIISVSAVGSMKEEIHPGDIVIPHQFYDHTKGRASTFFGEGIVAHISLADPVCQDLSEILSSAGEICGARIHRGGTYLCIEGPQFSTRAESLLYRQWGVDVIGMTNVTEAKLAREAEICYATLALATDYDCWHTTEEAVTAEAVLGILQRNVETSQKIIREALPHIPKQRECPCAFALRNAIITEKKRVPKKTREKLRPILGRYLQ